MKTCLNLGTPFYSGHTAQKPCLVQLSATFARPLLIFKIHMKRIRRFFALIPQWAHMIMGTPFSILGTHMGTHLSGFVRNMQAHTGTKNPHLSGLSMGYAVVCGTLRKWFYLPMQNRPKIMPSRSSAVNSPVIRESASCARRRSSAANSS